MSTRPESSMAAMSNSSFVFAFACGIIVISRPLGSDIITAGFCVVLVSLSILKSSSFPFPCLRRYYSRTRATQPSLYQETHWETIVPGHNDLISIVGKPSPYH